MFVKITLKIVTFLNLLFYLNIANAQMIDAFVCHDCTQPEAKQLASTKYVQPRCRFEDLNGGPATIDETQVVCEPTQKDVVILNPQDKIAYKFKVSAFHTQQFSVQLNVQNLSLSTEELETAQAFYQFFDDIVLATDNGMLNLDPNLFSNFSSLDSIGDEFRKNSTDDSSDTAACHVLKEYMNPQSRSEVEQFVIDTIISRLNGSGQNVYDLNEDVDVSGIGINLSKNSVGFQVYMDSEERPVFAAIGDGANKIIFGVEFGGLINEPGQAKIISKLWVNKNRSTVDSRSFEMIFDVPVTNDTQTTGTSDSPCLRELLQQIANSAPWGNFVGDGLESSNQLNILNQDGIQFCTRSVSARVCMSDENGASCSETIYHFPVACQ
ncbi:hypothetical protein [Glaciecola sp. 1036]|uniref:hypothetical protein n=1 Tax=Alteromonadaceae TaxID=72275 RepID=UPI003CFCE312